MLMDGELSAHPEIKSRCLAAGRAASRRRASGFCSQDIKRRVADKAAAAKSWRREMERGSTWRWVEAISQPQISQSLLCCLYGCFCCSIGLRDDSLFHSYLTSLFLYRSGAFSELSVKWSYVTFFLFRFTSFLVAFKIWTYTWTMF